MTWQETHDRTRAVREVEQALAQRPAAPLPWRAEWARLFGDPAGLATFLRYRWRLRLEAQIDPALPTAVLDDRLAALRREAAALRFVPVDVGMAVPGALAS